MKLVQRANRAKSYLDVFGLITAPPAGGDGGQLQDCGYFNNSSSLVLLFFSLELLFISWQTEVAAPLARTPPAPLARTLIIPPFQQRLKPEVSSRSLAAMKTLAGGRLRQVRRASERD